MKFTLKGGAFNAAAASSLALATLLAPALPAQAAPAETSGISATAAEQAFPEAFTANPDAATTGAPDAGLINAPEGDATQPEPAGLATADMNSSLGAGARIQAGLPANESLAGGVSTQASWTPAGGVLGMDVSSFQPNVNWAAHYQRGVRFAYTKATEGTYYKNPSFNDQYTDSYNAGMIRGAYHFANPREGSGADQARYFVANGGGWSADGKTLPGLLDLEFNPYQQYGNTCFNMSAAQLVAWTKDFVDTYRQLTGRNPMLYTATSWWTTCLGTAQFSNLLLHLASYSTVVGPMPSGWSNYDIWQFSSTGPFDGDSNHFRGSYNDLVTLAKNPAAVAGNWHRNYPAAQPTPASRFKDVPTGTAFKSEIEWLAASGITTGYSDGTFRPSQNVERRAMAAYFYRMAGSPAVSLPARSPFKDVATNDPFYKEIVWMKQRGITTGYSDGTFRPDASVSREAMAAFFYRFAGSPAHNAGSQRFRDVPVSSPFYKEVSWLAARGITTGWSDGTFRPGEAIHRDAMAAFIQRYKK